jgi:hypothetical protein
MNRRWFRGWWLLLLVPIIAGLARLHFDVEMPFKASKFISNISRTRANSSSPSARRIVTPPGAPQKTSRKIYRAPPISSRPSPGSRRGWNIPNKPPNSSRISG